MPPESQGVLLEEDLLTARMLKFLRQLACDFTGGYVILLSLDVFQKTELIFFNVMLWCRQKLAFASNLNKIFKNDFDM